MKSKIILSLVALALGLIAIDAAKPVFAQNFNYSEARHTANLNAFKNGDYQAWATNMKDRGATRFVNETNFKEFSQAQLAAQNGNRSLLDTFRAKYGMGQRKGMGQKNGQGRGIHAPNR